MRISDWSSDVCSSDLLLMIPIVSFYLMRDWDRLVAWIATLIPPRVLPRTRRFALEADEVLGSFIRGQLLVMAALATIYSVGLTLTGLKLGLIIGVIAGLLSFVPYLGFVVGFGAALIAMLVQTHEWLPLLWICLVFRSEEHTSELQSLLRISYAV